MQSVLLAFGAFIVMEPITAATHRFVMHGRGPGRILAGLGIALHRSHHRRRHSAFEANDAYPVIFAGIVCLGLWAGFNQPNLGGLIPVGIGVTAYGLAYAAVHDVYIHQRLRIFGSARPAVLEYLADAHRIHHLYNAAPYGMLVPIVPKELRNRAAVRPDDAADPLRQRVAATPGT